MTMEFQSYGSQQWRLLRRALRDGKTIEEAAATIDGMCVAEARDLAKIDAERGPLPDEAFALLYDPDAPRAVSSPQQKEAAVAKEDDAGEYKRPDAAKAFEIYDKQIKPKEAHLATIKGDMSEPYQAIKDQAHFPRKVLNFILALENEEDAKRDHHLLALSEGLKHRKIFLPRDLVTMAKGEDGGELIPVGDADDDDLLVDEDEDEVGEVISGTVGDRPDDAHPGEKVDTFTEATEEELAAQEGRESKPRARRTARTPATPAPGTGAAARQAMSTAATAH